MKAGFDRGMVCLAVLLAALPFVLPNAYFVDVAVRMAFNAVIVIGLNLLVGYTGQISLGHAGFYGIGAYSSAILCTRFGLPPVLALIAGMAASGALALLVARPMLRLRGHYLAMGTLGVGFIVYIVLMTESAWTGGPDGTAVPVFTVGGFAIDSSWRWYGTAAVVLLLIAGAARNLVRSPCGRALQAIHGSEVAARAFGIDAARFKTRAFVASAVVASLVGSLSAHYIGFVTPGVAGMSHSIELVTMVVVGGMASVWGSVLGAVLLTLLPQVLASLEGWETVVYGALLMGFMIFLPRGIVPTLAERWARRRSGKSPVPLGAPAVAEGEHT